MRAETKRIIYNELRLLGIKKRIKQTMVFYNPETQNKGWNIWLSDNIKFRYIIGKGLFKG